MADRPLILFADPMPVVSAVVWGENDALGIKVNCRADAGDFSETIPYAILATFEIAPEYNIDVYQKVVEKIKLKEAIAP